MTAKDIPTHKTRLGTGTKARNREPGLARPRRTKPQAAPRKAPNKGQT